ncbi:hypothetical protein FWC31_01935 [Candidatus Saccharibacteria bacterium]|nr:hypothetical protein [Candidatus Saccharibacteria bacterium]
MNTNSAITTISLRDFRENTQKVIDSLRVNKKVTVYKRSKPLFTISPPEVDEWGDAGYWTGVDLRSTKHPNGMPADEFSKKLRKIRRDLGEI